MTSKPAAAIGARSPSPRAPARDARGAAEERVAEESLSAHARRLLRARASAAATAVLDAGIASLQRLRKMAGGAQDTDGAADEDWRKPRDDRLHGRRDMEAPPAAAFAPAPKLRMRAFLLYLSAMLAGGMGGGALGYNLFAKLFDRQFTQNGRLHVTISKLVKSTIAARKELQQAKAKRIEAERKLEVSLADYAKSSAEKQKQLDEAQSRVAAMLAADRASNPRQPLTVSRSRTGGKVLPVKTANCNVEGNDVSSLKGCINDYYR